MVEIVKRQAGKLGHQLARALGNAGPRHNDGAQIRAGQKMLAARLACDEDVTIGRRQIACGDADAAGQSSLEIGKVARIGIVEQVNVEERRVSRRHCAPCTPRRRRARLPDR